MPPQQGLEPAVFPAGILRDGMIRMAAGTERSLCDRHPALPFPAGAWDQFRGASSMRPVRNEGLTSEMHAVRI